MEVDLHGTNAIKFVGKVSARLHDTLRMLPTRVKKSGDTLYVEKSVESAKIIMARHPEYLFSPSFLSWAATSGVSQSKTFHPRIALPSDPADFKFRSAPYAHQIEALRRYKDSKFFGLFFEMGCGKTKTTLDIAAWKYLSGQIDSLLVIAPKGVHEQWVKDEVPLHLPEQIEWYESFIWRPGKSKSKLEERAKALKPSPNFRIAAVNIDALSTDMGLDFCKKFALSGRCMVVIDESIYIKDKAAERSKGAMKLGSLAEVRVILNGAPITNGVQDLFSQLTFLSTSVLGITSFRIFQATYLVMGGWEMRKVVGARNIEDLQNRIDKHCMRVLKEDCLDLPPRIYINREVELTTEQATLYDRLRKDFIAELESGVILDASLATTRLIRLQQVTWGYVRDGEKQVTRLRNNRIDAIIDILRESPRKTIIWCKFREEIAMIAEALEADKIHFLEYHGGTKDRQDVKTKFQTEEKYQVLIANEAAYRGLNLTAATQVIWYSLTYSLDGYQQANDRCHRIGQHHPVTVIHLMSPKTVDVRILRALHGKRDIAESVLDIRELVLDDEWNVDVGLSHGNEDHVTLIAESEMRRANNPRVL